MGTKAEREGMARTKRQEVPLGMVGGGTGGAGGPGGGASLRLGIDLCLPGRVYRHILGASKSFLGI